jgi:hypothetical protein
MQCAKCGHDNVPQAKFCAKCGGPLLVAGEASPVSDGLKIGISIASVVMPIIGIIMGIIYVAKPNPSKKAVGKLWLIAAGVGILLWVILRATHSG